MRMLGGQFVMGRTIDEALARATRGRAARLPLFLRHAGRGGAHRRRRRALPARPTSDAIARDRQGGGRPAASTEAPGISVKLSALHPRYELAQRERVMHELLPRCSALARQARDADIGFTIDAEEADRLELSLDLIEALALDAGARRLGRARPRGAGLPEARACR